MRVPMGDTGPEWVWVWGVGGWGGDRLTEVLEGGANIPAPALAASDALDYDAVFARMIPLLWLTIPSPHDR